MNAITPLRELGTPLADISQPTPFTVVQTALDGFFPRGQLQAYWKSVYLREFADEAIDVIVDRAQEREVGRSSPYELVYFEIFPLGGAVNRVEPTATAFGERSAPWLVTIDANWTDPDDNASAISWVRRSWDDLNNRFGTGSAYLNFEGREGDTSEEDGAGAVAANLGRLAEVKAKYDPDNFFRRNNNIAPTI